jgi:class 3 adenylate cyclase/DNA-binding transcriptional MerR regulator
LLTSKEIIERTGISRATLNNYIASGLVPRPQVLPPGPEDGAAPRIGYFPDDTVARVEAIQRLKREGWSIARIAEHLAAHPPGQAPQPRPVALAPPPAFAAAQPPIAPVPPSLSPRSQVAPAAHLGATGSESSGPRADASIPPVPHAAPAVTSVAVLISTLQDARDLWVKLTAQEYFELLNEVWAEADRIFRRHRGRPGPQGGEVLVCYFLPQADGSYLWNALAAAYQTRDAMRQVSHRWQVRKGWDVELCMNIGVDEGQEWMGVVGATGEGALRVVGDTADHAEQLSRVSRMGAILVTRSLLGKLAAEERQRLTFGVPRLEGARGEAPVLFTFARLADMAAPVPVPARFADLAVAELLDLVSPSTATPAARGAG